MWIYNAHCMMINRSHQLRCSLHVSNQGLNWQLISVIFIWFLLSSYLLKLLVFLYFFWFYFIYIYIYLFICALKEWENFRLIYKGFTCKVGLGQLNQVNLHPAKHEFKRRPTQLNLSPTGARNQRKFAPIQVQFGLGFQLAHQLVFLA